MTRCMASDVLNYLVVHLTHGMYIFSLRAENSVHCCSDYIGHFDVEFMYMPMIGQESKSCLKWNNIDQLPPLQQKYDLT